MCIFECKTWKVSSTKYHSAISYMQVATVNYLKYTDNNQIILWIPDMTELYMNQLYAIVT